MFEVWFHLILQCSCCAEPVVFQHQAFFALNTQPQLGVQRFDSSARNGNNFTILYINNTISKLQ